MRATTMEGDSGEREVHNFILVWLTILISLIYCHTLAKFIPKGTIRLFALIPVISLFLFLPLNLSSVCLGGLTSFFISWLANFKLILFAFGRGPLSPNPNSPLPLSHFLPTACFPIKILHHPNGLYHPSHQKRTKTKNPSHKMVKDENPFPEMLKNENPSQKSAKIENPSQKMIKNDNSCQEMTKNETPFPKMLKNENPSQRMAKLENPFPTMLKNEDSSQKLARIENPSQKMIKNEHPYQGMGKKSPWNYAVKILLFCGLLRVYKYNQYFHPKLRMALYCFHIYFVLEIGLAVVAHMARALVRVELEPQFDEPYLATSLQDFWGKRWNLMVTGILHPTVYNPVRQISARVISREWAPLPAVLATFMVSGLMHELIFYYIGRLRPTGDVTVFFLIHGVSLGIEILIKKALDGKKFRLPAAVSRPMALGFVLLTSFWFFFPPFLKFHADLRGCKETMALVEFVKHGHLISPNDISCPYF